MLIINSHGKIENTDSFAYNAVKLLKQLHNDRLKIIATCYLDTATGECLDALASNYNIIRRDSQSDDQLRGEITSFLHT